MPDRQPVHLSGQKSETKSHLFPQLILMTPCSNAALCSFIIIIIFNSYTSLVMATHRIVISSENIVAI